MWTVDQEKNIGPLGVRTNTTRWWENGVWKMDRNRNMRKKLSPESSCVSASSVSNTYSHLWALLVEFSSSRSFILLLGWPDLHLGELQRVLPSRPGWPLDAVGIWGVLAAQVLSVEVGGVAVAVPPGSMVEGRAVILRVVVVLVLSGEFHPVVFEQRVACSVGSMRDGKKDWERQRMGGRVSMWETGTARKRDRNKRTSESLNHNIFVYLCHGKFRLLQ